MRSCTDTFLLVTVLKSVLFGFLFVGIESDSGIFNFIWLSVSWRAAGIPVSSAYSGFGGRDGVVALVADGVAGGAKRTSAGE